MLQKHFLMWPATSGIPEIAPSGGQVIVRGRCARRRTTLEVDKVLSGPHAGGRCDAAVDNGGCRPFFDRGRPCGVYLNVDFNFLLH